MRIYFDIDNCRHTNGRGVPTNEPVTLTQGSIPEIDVVFLHNGGVVIPELRALSLRLGKVGSACLTSTNVYTTGAGGVHTLHLDLSSDAVASALSGDSWTAAVGNGSARTYSFANSSAEPALLRAVGFRVAIGSVYIPSGLFSIDTVARTVTLDA